MKTVRRARVLAALIASAALVLAACTSSSGDGRSYSYSSAQAVGDLIPTADRKAVPDFGGSLLSGGDYKLSSYRGKAIVVNFWGTWCGPCTVETPQFQKVYDAYKSKGVSFVGIDIGDGTRDAPKSFVRDNHITYPIVYDETNETALRMGNIRVRATPFTVLLDTKHRVAGVYAATLSRGDLEPMLNRLVAGK